MRFKAGDASSVPLFLATAHYGGLDLVLKPGSEIIFTLDLIGSHLRDVLGVCL